MLRYEELKKIKIESALWRDVGKKVLACEEDPWAMWPTWIRHVMAHKCMCDVRHIKESCSLPLGKLFNGRRNGGTKQSLLQLSVSAARQHLINLSHEPVLKQFVSLVDNAHFHRAAHKTQLEKQRAMSHHAYEPVFNKRLRALLMMHTSSNTHTPTCMRLRCIQRDY